MDNQSKFYEWLEAKDLGSDAPKILNEVASSSRYSVEVNYRTDLKEFIEGFAKISLGYISAAMKNCGYHAKIYFNDHPYRVFVSTRNWDDGEWVGVVVFNPDKKCFVLAKGTYNKDRKTVSIDSSRECAGKSAAEVVRELRNHMEKLKKDKPRGSSTLEPAKLKRGPKPTHLKKLSKISGPWKPSK
jgi:hypothetical protein